jgi:hypothetical protein
LPHVDCTAAHGSASSFVERDLTHLVSCGSLTTGRLVISGMMDIPVPAAAWLIAPGLLAVGHYARRKAATPRP